MTEHPSHQADPLIEDLEVFSGPQAAGPELIIGLVGPIGVNMDLVQNKLIESLRQVEYNPRVIHITQLLERVHKRKSKDGPTAYDSKIDHANEFCSQRAENSALAALAISEIIDIRVSLHASSTSQTLTDDDKKRLRLKPFPKTAYIIRQLKRSDEVQLLSDVYGEHFIQVSVNVDEDHRITNLTNRLSVIHPEYSAAECDRFARDLVRRDAEESSDRHGQRVGKIFHLADVFVNAESERDAELGCARFVSAFFGKNTISPTKDEYGAYAAKGASLRSADLSRQVGSAVFNKHGDLITQGFNDVPKYGGGHYWFEDEFKQRDVERQAESNKVETNRIITNFLKSLEATGALKDGQTWQTLLNNQKVRMGIEDALVSDITEYGRMTHAEMTAICDAARIGRSIQGATMYVTTFPCHNCAKHIVASGIIRVVFIEPYPKSKALTSHEDSISTKLDARDRVIFEHFEGISPRRYRKIFEKGRRRDRTTGEILEWYEGKPMPRISDRSRLYVGAEAAAIKRLRRAPVS